MYNEFNEACNEFDATFSQNNFRILTIMYVLLHCSIAFAETKQFTTIIVCGHIFFSCSMTLFCLICSRSVYAHSQLLFGNNNSD